MRTLPSLGLVAAAPPPAGLRAWIIPIGAAVSLLAPVSAMAQEDQAVAESQLVAVSADIVEISGSASREIGFTWSYVTDRGGSSGLSWIEKEIPGILKVGEFARQTALQTQLNFLEREGKAQSLANPKIITKSGASAEFFVGNEYPFPQPAGTGTPGVDYKKVGIRLEVVPTVQDPKKGLINVGLKMEVANLGDLVPVGGGLSQPTIVTRGLVSDVDLLSGETLVIGGLKRSDRRVGKSRIPVLGRIPLLGALFTTSVVTEDQASLFLFITAEIVK